MQSTVNVAATSLYDTDYQQWIEQTVAQLRSGSFTHVDVENLIEEIESLGKRDKRAIFSYLMRLCEHLLKLLHWHSERETCERGWIVEIRNFRLRIQAILDDSPSLKNYIDQRFVEAYQAGRKLFLDASGLDEAIAPESPCFSLEQALDEDWLPSPRSRN